MTAAQQMDFNPPARDELQPGAVGRLLRETREGYRQDIATVSQQLRIRSVYLKAIEDGNYQDLPGSTYAVGFVRTYAEYLGLDPQEIVRRFRDEDAEVNRRTKLVFPVPNAEAKVPSGALVLIALVLAVVAYGGWYYLSDRDRSLVDLVPSVPESLKDLVNSSETVETDSSDDAPTPTAATAAETDSNDDAPSTASETATTVIAPGADTETDAPSAETTATTLEPGAALTALDATGVEPADPGAELYTDLNTGAAEDAASANTAATELGTVAATSETAAADAASDTTTDAAADAQTATDTATDAAAATTEAAAIADPAAEQVAAIPEAPRVPDSVQDGQSFGTAFGGTRVVIVARMESFLRVRDEAGNEIWSRLLRSGDRYLVPEREGLTLYVGNAGGIDIFVDGAKAPALGAVGVGAGGVSLDPERLRSGTALP